MTRRASVFSSSKRTQTQTIIPQSYITELCWGMKNFFNLIWDSSYTGIMSNFNIVSLRNIIVIYLIVLSFRPETMCSCDDPFTVDDWSSAMTLRKNYNNFIVDSGNAMKLRWTKFLDERGMLVYMTEIKYHAVCRTLHFYIRCKRSSNVEKK